MRIMIYFFRFQAYGAGMLFLYLLSYLYALQRFNAVQETTNTVNWFLQRPHDEQALWLVLILQFPVGCLVLSQILLFFWEKGIPASPKKPRPPADYDAQPLPDGPTPMAPDTLAVPADAFSRPLNRRIGNDGCD